MAHTERLGIAGTGTIACGLAAVAANRGEVVLWARSERSAARARASLEQICSTLRDKPEPDRIRVVRNLDGLAEATFVVEAVVEDHASKAAVLSELSGHAASDTVLSTTTSALSIAELAREAGRPDRFLGLHVFNPVTRMKLVELVFPEEATGSTRARARAVCEALGKTAIEVPDIPGFVVNRLLFPYLFGAVELLSEQDLSPENIDQCMMLGAGVPMGPLALLDYVGLDVAEAIGQALKAPVPKKLSEMVKAGMLGRKSGRGFYTYD